MKITPFQDWLEDKFISDISPQTIKDRFEDDFERWIADLEYDDYVKLADEYGKYVEHRCYQFMMKANMLAVYDAQN